MSLLYLMTPGPPPDPAFLLQPGRAGRFEVGMKVDEVYRIAGRQNVRLVDIFAEGLFTPAIEIAVAGGPSLVAPVREWPCPGFSLQGITVRDRRFRTKEGIGVGSSVADVRRHSSVKSGHGEGGPVAIADDLGLTFELTDETPSARVKSIWIYAQPERLRAERCPQLPPPTPAPPQAPAHFSVRLDTTKGPIVIAVHRDWAPHGADRFHELVTSGYYDQAAVFRIRKGTWAQFGIAADPTVAQAWRTKTIPDDPYKGVSNKRGTVAFAFKDPNGRTTQVFINLKDNSETHDKEPFVIFGEVVQGMEIADAFYAEYGEAAGGGIRAGKQDPVFAGGNAYLKEKFPLLDYIRTARIIRD
jgi:homoserine O-acetyltransferase